jgi:hypothetical protein
VQDAATPVRPQPVTRKGVNELTKRKLLVGLTTLALSVGATAPAFAVPDFGPGNSQKGPHDGGAKCHPPGQTVFEPGCK